MQPKILVVLTSTDKIESINHPTGWYLVRFCAACRAVLQPSLAAGHD
jgi:hypothetical protein